MAMDWEPATYGERVAPVYDDWCDDTGDLAASVSFLAARAGAGLALELGIGTGRVALPLAQRGIPVHGIEASEAMAVKLREKPGGESVAVILGNFADVDVIDRYSLVFVTVSTFFQLTTQDEQVRCFENVARCLSPGGCFVVEADVPDFRNWSQDQTTMAARVVEDEVVLVAAQHNPAEQSTMWQNIRITSAGTELFPDRNRYVWPGEMDLMARLAGLRLAARSGGWRGERYTGAGIHVSVYERGAAG